MALLMMKVKLHTLFVDNQVLTLIGGDYNLGQLVIRVMVSSIIDGVLVLMHGLRFGGY